MLVALSCGALLSTATTVGINPFLLDIARDLRTDLAAAGNLVALQCHLGASRRCLLALLRIVWRVDRCWWSDC
jgi:predicted MFS family arabinose efflux permease